MKNQPSSAVFLLLIACLGFQPITTDLYLATLPTLAKYFGVSARAIDSTMQTYLIVYAIAQLITGPLSDRFGRRPILLSGITIHVLASFGAIFAPNLSGMNAARAFQAIGVCCTVVCCRAIIRDSLEPKEGAMTLSKAMTWMGLIALLSPLIGGLLQMVWGWQAAFAFIAAFGSFCLVLALRGYRETNRFMTPSATHWRTLFTNYFEIIKHKRFLLFTLIAAGTYSGLIVFLAKSPSVLIQHFALSPVQFGLSIACCTVGFITGTLVGRRVFAAFGTYRTLLLGAVISISASGAMFALVQGGFDMIVIYVGFQVLFMIAHGMLQPIAQAMAISDFPEKAGAAAALMGFFIHVLAALWLTVAGGLAPVNAWPSAVICASFVIGCAVIALRKTSLAPTSSPLFGKRA